MAKFLVLVFLIFSITSHSQVTIGSSYVPNKGALLDLKQEEKKDGSANSQRGLGLPRVSLDAIDRLDPCVVGADDESKKKHIGLTVYNTTDNTDTDATLTEGVYAWDGELWAKYTGGTSAANGLNPLNGLSLDGKNIILGGSLDRNTTISGTNILIFDTPTTIGKNLSVTGTTTLTGNLTSNGATNLKSVNISGNSVTTGDSKSGTSTVTGNATVGGTLSVTGTTTLTGNLSLNGTTNLKSVNISGNSVTTGDSKTGTSTITGNATVGGTLSVTGATTLTGNLTSNGTTNLKNVNISGNSVTTGDSKSATLTVTGKATVGGALSVTGATTLSDMTVGTTTAKKSAKINGTLHVSDTPILANSTALVVDQNGQIGTAAAIPTKVAFLQSQTKTEIPMATYNSMNSGNHYTVPWTNSDIATNNGVLSLNADNTITVSNSGLYEISGYSNWNFNYVEVTTNTPKSFMILISVQIQKKGTSTWSDFTSARYKIFPTPDVSTNQTLLALTDYLPFPSAVITLDAGDKLRVTLRNPMVGRAEFNWPTFSSANLPNISAATGGKFSRGLKVQVL